MSNPRVLTIQQWKRAKNDPQLVRILGTNRYGEFSALNGNKAFWIRRHINAVRGTE